MQLTSANTNGKRGEFNMKFLIQMVVLFFVGWNLGNIFDAVFPGFTSTTGGLAVTVTAAFALGWYWVRIWNYVEAKVLGVVQKITW